MTTFGWLTRLKYGVLAGLAGWLAGMVVTFPFQCALAWRYVDANVHRLPDSLAEGFLVWAAFSLFMAVSGFVPLVLPFFLLITPAWIVRWRRVLIPLAPLTALVIIDQRMGFLHPYYFRHSGAVRIFFFTGPNFFLLTFALVVIWAYVALAKRRLSVHSGKGQSTSEG